MSIIHCKSNEIMESIVLDLMEFHRHSTIAEVPVSRILSRDSKEINLFIPHYLSFTSCMSRDNRIRI